MWHWQPVQRCALAQTKSKLQGAFRASGKGDYAIIVYNNSVVPATYALSTDGGVLVETSRENGVVQALP